MKTPVSPVLPADEARAWAATAREVIALTLAPAELDDLGRVALGDAEAEGFVVQVGPEVRPSLARNQFVALLDVQGELRGRLRIRALDARRVIGDVEVMPVADRGSGF